MSVLIEGGQWWARVAEKNNDSKQAYWRVVAWERVTGVEGDPDREQLVAWINGRDPIRSDAFYEHVTGWVLYDFVDTLPAGATVSSWA
ncbi:hypothetical protein BOH66_01235 [Microbacterium aurum]|uniref:Uncharacterized protein n=1 Tax=Microbacterium aurum TaxID=36805 RepID=A0A1P8U4N8_9MICO|nr:hypothetical protein [Microbacterium aurum]APZ33074.1 hypothetical protein BOH66_01235 [Microbacterium aurum]MBM7826633.1 hypothetical protein [Microbacterium aurum]